MDTIEDIVRSYVIFTGVVSSKGWHSIYCEVCGDGTHSKGQRGGWLFQDEICFYSCFNCSISGNFDPNREHPHSKEMYNIFRSFDIPSNDINSILTEKITDTKVQVKREKLSIPHLEPHTFFKPLVEFDDDDLIADEARNFLWEHYNITQDDFPFLLSTGKTESTDTQEIYLSRALRPRIIIPAYYNGRLIFWQARLFVGEGKKYISSSDDSNTGSVMFGMDNMRHSQTFPLYITEGFADSWHVNGVAVIRNSLNHNKIVLLERVRRPKVVIPDYNMDGMHLAKQAIENEWGVSLPETMPCRDICSAILHFFARIT